MDQVQHNLKKRGSEREIGGDAVDPVPDVPRGKTGLKKARSEAEIIRVWQGYAMIFLALSNIGLTVMIYLTR